MNNIFILGYFGYVTNQLDGQTIKTREIYELFKTKYTGAVTFFDTQNFKNKPLNIIKLFKLVHNSNVIVYLPGQSNLRYVFPLISLFIKKRTKIIYPVVGGWLDSFLCDRPWLIKQLSKFTLIGAETKRLKNNLESLYHFNNVKVLTNFRSKEYVPFANPINGILRVVFMARITRAKGCDTIFEIAERLEKENIDNIKFTFYGKIDPSYESVFLGRIKKLNNNCSYGGLIQPQDVYSTLNRHDVLILPTFYEGEGFPGSVIDSYKAGIPVIVSKWKDLPEFVVQGKTGFVVELNRHEDFYKLLIKLSKDSEALSDLKKHAYLESMNYSSEGAWSVISEYLDN